MSYFFYLYGWIRIFLFAYRRTQKKITARANKISENACIRRKKKRRIVRFTISIEVRDWRERTFTFYVYQRFYPQHPHPHGKWVPFLWLVCLDHFSWPKNAQFFAFFAPCTRVSPNSRLLGLNIFIGNCLSK